MTQRETTEATILNLLGPAQIEKKQILQKNKKQNMGEVVKFLAVNELPLCGNLESTESQVDRHDFSAGLFLKIVEYTLN